MIHATEGLLQAYMDGEIDSTESGLADHLASCERCASELQELQQLSARVHEALGVLETTPPMVRAQAALQSQRRAASRAAGRLPRLGGRSLLKAAMLLLVLGGAVAAAVPGSPVWRALETTLARVSQILGGAADPVPPPVEPVVPPAPAMDVASMAIQPADGRVRVVLHAPSGAVDVFVRLVDSSRAVVETETRNGDVRLRSGLGRVEVTGLTTGTVTIDIPATVPHASIEAGGRVHVYKDGAELQLSGAAGGGRGTAVSFRIGS
jgi:anti-sigma factor RsiW